MTAESVAVLCDYSCLPLNGIIVWWGTECFELTFYVSTDSAYLQSCRRDSNTKKAAHLTWLIQTVLKTLHIQLNFEIYFCTKEGLWIFFTSQLLNRLHVKCTVRTRGMIRDYFMYNWAYGHVSGQLGLSWVALKKCEPAENKASGLASWNCSLVKKDQRITELIIKLMKTHYSA